MTRINKFVAAATGLSRRAADAALFEGRVTVNGMAPLPGYTVQPQDAVTLDGKQLSLPTITRTILLNKPAGYVVSRDGQGSKTVYDLLPAELHALKPIGRLDKQSSGLLVLTTDGALAHELTHPSQQKVKIYEVTLDQPLQPLHRQMIQDHGIQLDDGPSSFQIDRLADADDTMWHITMYEGRNRQIRRTFAALGYAVTRLHRTQFGTYQLGSLKPGAYQAL